MFVAHGEGESAAPNAAAYGREEGSRTDPPAAGNESSEVNPSHSVVNHGDGHLRPLLQQMNELSEKENEQTVGLIKRYGDVFTENEFDLGSTPLLQH